MHTFFLALLLIAAGGILAPISCKVFPLMKMMAVAAIIGGGLLGTWDAGIRLIHHTPSQSFTLPWLGFCNFSLQIDILSAFFLVLIFTVPAVAALYSLHYLRDTRRSTSVAANYFFFALLIISMALVVCADSLITFALAWELMSLSSFFLVIYDSDKKETRDAGYLYFVFTQGGALFIFAGLGLLYSSTGNFSFTGFGDITESAKLIAFLLILIGCGSKAGIIPLHTWLPHAHPAAPSHVSAVMSGVMIKVGIYGILRFYLLLQPGSPLVGQIIIVLGIISGILGVVYALGKHNLKRLLAYHSVENIGIILLGLGVGMLGAASGNRTMAAFGFAGGLLHVLNHAVFKSLLFLGAGAVIQHTGTATIDRLGGLMKTMPFTGRSFLIGSISITGLPPFNGFISEFLIYYGAFHGLDLHHGSFVVTVLAIVSLAVIGGLAAACFTKVVGIVFLGEPRNISAARAMEAGISMLLAQGILASLCLLIGIWPEYFVQAAFEATQLLYPGINIGSVTFLPVVTSISRMGMLCIVLIFCTDLCRRLLTMGKEVRHASTWGCGFTRPTPRMQYTGTSYSDSMVSFFRPFVRVLNRYPGMNTIFPERVTYSSHVHDIFELGLQILLVRPMLFLTGRLRWIQHGNIQLYIGYIVLVILIMLLFL
jgi:hydrogenase-4 component B